MSEPDLQLITPRADLADEYRRMVAQFTQAGEESHQDEIEAIEADFAQFVESLSDHQQGLELPEKMVDYSTYWLTYEDELIGTARLRHRLTDELAISYGNIGYDVKPSARAKGFATKLLAMMLQKAGDLGLEKVLLTCEAENPASARVIEKNGGKLLDEVISSATGLPIRRYWIELG